jgi:2-polyprenyl-3-methyl-5-hydroxy-6-metoxy-1,4-benzoquinol methylase
MARLGWDATGLDFDPRAIAAARSRGLNVSAGDVRSMAYSAASFDAIVMTHVIEHVVDPVGLLKECRRILKPQGTLVLVTPNPSSLGHRIYGRAWRGLEPPRHLVIFPPEALRLACAKAGIGVSRIIFSPRDAANLFLSSERLSHVRPHEQIRRPDSSATPPLRLRILENIERIACWLKRPSGEEQILIGHPLETDPTPG